MNRSILVFSALGLTLFLSACDMYEPSIVTAHKVEVLENEFYDELLADEVTDSYIAATAEQFERYGEGPIMITVTYDPQSAGNTAMVASGTLSDVVNRFKSRGIKQIKADILPVKQQGEVGHVMITFTSYEARGPEDCGMMAGMEGDEVRNHQDYKLGCTIENLYAKQVSDPRDLLGRDEMGVKDGRRAANIIEGYRSGQPNKPLEGESASD